jgi:hypothetical protein
METTKINTLSNVNKGFNGFKSWGTEWETNLIVDFLKTNRSIIRLDNIGTLANLPNNCLNDVLWNNYKSIRPDKIDKLLPILKMLGFELKPRPDDDFFYEPVEEFKCELAPEPFPEPDPQEDVDKIIYISKAVCSYFNVPIEMFNSVTRKREIVQARQITMYFCKKKTKASFATIGLHVGDKDHATVMHACKTVDNLIETDKKFASQIDEIKLKIKSK